MPTITDVQKPTTLHDQAGEAAARIRKAALRLETITDSLVGSRPQDTQDAPDKVEEDNLQTKLDRSYRWLSTLEDEVDRLSNYVGVDRALASKAPAVGR